MSDENDILVLVVVENGEIGTQFELTEKVTIVGRKSKDIKISDASVSSRHVSLTLDGDGVLVKDLGSKNGTYIEQEKIQEGRLNLGETLRLGQVGLSLESSGDKTITSILQSEESALSPVTPESAPIVPAVQESNDDINMTIFDDEDFSPIKDQSLNLVWDSKERDYIDFADDEPDLQDSENIVERRSEEKSLEVTTLVSGRIFAKDYFPLNNETFYTGKSWLGKKVVDLPGFYDQKSRAVIEIKDGVPHLLKLENFQCRSSKRGLLEGECWELEEGDTLSLESGVTQLMIRYGKTPPILKTNPLLKFDRVDIQRFAISLAGIVVLFLLTLLFDTRIEEAKKKTVSVVYRPQPILKVRPKPKTTVNAESAKKAGSKSPVTKSKKNKSRSLAKKKSLRSNSKKVVQTKKKPVVKSYSLSRSKQNRLKNLFKSLSKSGSQRVVKDSSSAVKKTLSQVREVSGNQKGVSSAQAKNLGKVSGGLDGKYDTSTGSRGLSSKKGIAKVSYDIEPAEVSGGIDAELLKKILRELIPQFQHCYRRELIRNNNLEGVVDLYFRINPQGKARNIRVEGKRFSFSNDGESCMKKIFNLVELPKPPGGGVVDVKQALNFSSVKARS